jgi:zinc transporter ZupT
MGTVSVVTFDIVFIAERWLRHLGKLTPNTSRWQKIFALISIIASIAGAVGLILLTIYDNVNHSNMHNAMLALFILGYVVSAIFVCAEYQRLGIHYREHSILRRSFWIKLAFILIEIGLAIGFGVTLRSGHHHRNTAGILEWVVALVYAFYVASYYLDFLPARRTNSKGSNMTEEEMAMRDSEMARGRGEGYGGSVPYQNHTHSTSSMHHVSSPEIY